MDTSNQILPENNDTAYENRVIKYDNAFNSEKRFNRLTANEQKLFFAIISEYTESNKNKKEPQLGIVLKPSDVRRIAGLSVNSNHLSNKDLKKYLKRLSEAGHGLTCTIRKEGKDPNTGEIIKDENGKTVYVLGCKSIFVDFDYGEDQPYIIISIRPEMKNFFFNIMGGFSQFYLAKYINSFTSKYSMAIYRQLLNGKNLIRGCWNPTKEEFMDWVDIKTENSFKRFKKMLPKYMKEIESTNDFVFVKVELIRDRKKKNKITNICFQYKLKNNRMSLDENIIESYKTKQVYQRTIEEIDGKRKAQKSPYKCKECNGNVFEYTDNQNRTIYFCENSKEYKMGEKNCKNKNIKNDIKDIDIWIDKTDKINEPFPKENTNLATKTNTIDIIEIPTLEEVIAYFVDYETTNDITTNIDPEDFYDYYTARNWKINGQCIYKWQSEANRWIRREQRNEQEKIQKEQEEKERIETEKAEWKLTT